MGLSKTVLSLAAFGAIALSGAALAEDKIKIGVSYPTPTHAWASGMNWHAEQAEIRLEALYPDIDLILVNSPDPSAQASALEDLVSVHQIVALVVLPFESEPLTDPVLNVKKSGALITVVDRGLSQPGIEDIYVAGNNPEFGRVSAQYMKGRLKDGDNIVILRGIPTTIDNERFDAFMAEIEGTGINVLDHKHANWNRDDGFEVMQDFLSRFPDIDAVWAQDDDIAIGVVAALEREQQRERHLTLAKVGAWTLAELGLSPSVI